MRVLGCMPEKVLQGRVREQYDGFTISLKMLPCINLLVTDTLTSQTRPRSLRKRSTIMRFSALAFADSTRVALDSASSSGSLWRRAVPLIGRASTIPSAYPFRNLSGDEQQICKKSSGDHKVAQKSGLLLTLSLLTM